jgi:hypothetical protein
MCEEAFKWSDKDVCRTCKYWKVLAGGWERSTAHGQMAACHHLLETEKRRKVAEDGTCLSYTERKKRGWKNTAFRVGRSRGKKEDKHAV